MLDRIPDKTGTDLVRVMDDGELAVSFLDLVIIGILFNAENLVVILSLALLEFELGVADLLDDARLFRVGFVNSLEFLDSGLPVASLALGFGLCLSGLGVGGVKLESLFTVGDGFGVFLELGKC